MVRDHALQVFNDCGPCCECDDFLAVYEAIRQLRNKYASMIERAKTVRDTYASNKERFLASKSCREGNRLRIVVRTYCPSLLDIVVGYCNTTDECINNIVIPISFVYSDLAGDKDPFAESLPLTAESTDIGVIAPGLTYRAGNYGMLPSRGGLDRGSPELYAMAGTWPWYWVTFEGLQSGVLGQVHFQIYFPQAVSGARAEIVLDAYQVTTWSNAEPEEVPVAGYVTGGGPVLPVAKNNRMPGAPKKVVVPLVTDPCPNAYEGLF
jgi:hypothetical protein